VRPGADVEFGGSHQIMFDPVDPAVDPAVDPVAATKLSVESLKPTIRRRNRYLIRV
jgi:hypothetical protein